jgi:hypothetical protein
MDSRNKFHPLTTEKEALKVAALCKNYKPTSAQQFVVDTLMLSEDANMAALDIWMGKFIRNCEEENLMTDVKIYIDDQVFNVHRIMLARCSTYFHELFCISKSDCALPIELEIEEISADVFHLFLHFVYFGTCEITSTTVKDLSRIAKQFGVEELKNKIDEYFLSPLHESVMTSKDHHTVLKGGHGPPGDTIHQSVMSSADHLAVLVGCSRDLDHKMYESAIKSVIGDFKNIAKNAKFVSLNLDIVWQILTSDYLNVDNESDVFNAAKAWVQHDPRNREQHLPRVMECVRFPLMDTYEMVTILRDNDFLRNDKIYRSMIWQAIWYVSCLADYLRRFNVSF